MHVHSDTALSSDETEQTQGNKRSHNLQKQDYTELQEEAGGVIPVAESHPVSSIQN